jgi:hypothetical protein
LRAQIENHGVNENSKERCGLDHQLFTLEDVSALIDTSVAEHCELIRDKGAMMDKCCVDGYSWSGELLKINANFIKIKDNLGTILPEHYETNDNNQYIRKSFKANGF